MSLPSGETFTGKEHRGSRRFPLNLSVTLVRSGRREIDQRAETRNLSSTGVYFVAPAGIGIGSHLRFVIMLPELSSAPPIHVLCKGIVVREEVQSQGKIGVAATIERHEFVREGHSLFEAFGPSALRFPQCAAA
jgi:hypothetical protein